MRCKQGMTLMIWTTVLSCSVGLACQGPDDGGEGAATVTASAPSALKCPDCAPGSTDSTLADSPTLQDTAALRASAGLQDNATLKDSEPVKEIALNAASLGSIKTAFPRKPIKACVDQKYTGAPLGPVSQPVYDLPPAIDSAGNVSTVGVVQQPLVSLPNAIWVTGQTLRVRMDGGSPFVRSKVIQYANVWTTVANVHFTFVDSGDAEIRVTFDTRPGAGSWSMIGRESLSNFGGTSMNFGWFDDATPEQEFSRVVLHEFGHALGFVHEHQSPAAGIPWNKARVYQYYEGPPNNWDQATIDQNIFDKYSYTQTNYSAYDRTSIMEYPIPPEFTLDGSSAPNNTTLSSTDILYAGMWYPFPPSPQNRTGYLHTGDDCDEIQFQVDYNAVSSGYVEFNLRPGYRINWWKGVYVPVYGGYWQALEISDGTSASQLIPLGALDTSRALHFSKAKLFGVHTGLGFTWPVMPALIGGTRVTLTWNRDGC